MLSWQTLYERFQSLAQDSDSTNLTFGKQNINIGIRKLERELGMPPMQKERTITTVTSTNSYALPENFIDLDQLYVTISSRRYYARKVYNERDWASFMTQQNQVTSNNLTHVFVRIGLGTFEIYPIASSAGNTMTMIYSAFTKDLSADDYTSGTITTLTSGGTAITFAGTTLTVAMVGRWIKLPDGYWYKLSAFTDTTHMSIQQPYQGTAISSGSESFTIGEIPRLPDGTQEIPVHYALWQHFGGIRRDPNMASYYKTLYEEGVIWAKKNYRNRYSSAVIPSQRRKREQLLKDPNDFPDLSSLA